MKQFFCGNTLWVCVLCFSVEACRWSRMWSALP